MAALLRILVWLLALIGGVLFVVEAGDIWFDVGFYCFGPCQPYPGSPDPIYTNLTQTLAKVPSNPLPAGVTLAVAWAVCLALLLRAGRWRWALVGGLTLPLTTGLFLATAFHLPHGLPHVHAVNVSYFLSLLGLLAASFATPPPSPHPPPFLAAWSW